MNDRESGKKRRRVYYMAVWCITGLVFIYGAFFSYFSGFRKIAFSFPDNDIYEAGNGFQTEVLEEDRCELGQYVFLEHYDVNYLRIVTDGVDGEDARFYFTGTATEEGERVITIKSTLHNGINDFRLKRQDFQWAYYIVEGYDRSVIKNIQYRESKRIISDAVVVQVLLLSAAVYVVMTVLVIIFKKRCTREHE